MPMRVPFIWDMPVFWTYRRLACGVLAGLSLPLLLTEAAVGTFPQQVGVAAMAGVHLNHVDQHRAQFRAAAVRLEALTPRSGESATNFSAKATSSCQSRQASSTSARSATAPSHSASGTSFD
jgi:hypothetical protein